MLSRSQSFNIKREQSEAETSEVPENSFNALKQLKKINDYKEMLKGRLSVLQIVEQKNDFKASINEKRCHFHQQIREEMRDHQNKKAHHIQKVEENLLESQKRAQQERMARDANLRNAQKELIKSRANDYLTIKEKRKDIQRAISETKLQDIQAKRERKLQIRSYEKSQRNNVEMYLRNKKMEVRLSDNTSVHQLRKKKEDRNREIEELSKLQQMMIEKQSRSKLSKQESQMKLSKFFNGSSVSHSTTKLPMIASPSKRQKSEQALQ